MHNTLRREIDVTEPQQSHLNFRAPAELVDAIKRAAAHSGSCTSELIRTALRERLEAHEDPFARVRSAARGDINAQRSLAREAIASMTSPDEDRDPIVTLSEGLVFARLAASQGNTADQALVVSMLAMMACAAGEERSPDQIAEAVARLSIAADGGSDEAANMLPAISQQVSPAVMAMAGIYRGRVLDDQASVTAS